MKDLKYSVTVALAITTFVLFGFSGKSAISAETYVNSQDMCFRIDLTSPEVISWTLKFGVYQHEGGHYTLIGPDGSTGAVHGNAEVIGGNVVLNLVSRGSDGGDQYLDNISAILSLPGLSGSYHSFFTEEIDGNVVTISESGTMKMIPCP